MTERPGRLRLKRQLTEVSANAKLKAIAYGVIGEKPANMAPKSAAGAGGGVSGGSGWAVRRDGRIAAAASSANRKTG